MNFNHYTLSLFSIPLLAISLGCSTKKVNTINSRYAEMERQRQAALAKEKEETEKKQFSLEVYGLGISVEKYRQTRLWEEMQRIPPHPGRIFPSDPKEYDYSDSMKVAVYDKRKADALEHALRFSMRKWHTPVMAAGPTCHTKDPDYQLSMQTGFCWQDAGLHFHEFTFVELIKEDALEHALEKVFAFFDKDLAVPGLLLNVEDGLLRRHYNRPEGAPPIFDDGHRKPEDLDDSAAAFLFMRKDRVESIRPYAGSKAHPKNPFQPSTYLPTPWDAEQLKAFDELPLLGRVHRPRYVSYLVDGNPMDDKARADAFEKGWREALAKLPEGVMPARVFYDHGSAAHGKRLVPLSLALSKVWPDLDLFAYEKGINLFFRLGELGVASPYVGLALGIIGSHRMNDVSAIVNLRNENEASIFLVTPPTAEERKKIHPYYPDPLNPPLKP